jgi:hypothetical protein
LEKEIFLRLSLILVALPIGVILFPYFEVTIEEYYSEISLFFLCSLPILFVIRLVFNLFFCVLPHHWLLKNYKKDFSIFSFFENIILLFFLIAFIMFSLPIFKWYWLLVFLLCVQLVSYLIGKRSKKTVVK